LAQARATAKDIEGALETVSKLTSGLDDAVLTYSNIAMVQVRGSDIKGALNTLEEHIPKDGYWHNRSLAAIASAQAERGQDKEALAWVRKLTDSDTQADCLLGVANGLLLANKVGIRRP
jgi:lipopolysaccharide biosynthesis regulator YciM